MENLEPSGATSSFDFASHKFAVPTKKIDDNQTLEAFKKSDALNELLSFIGAIT